MCGRYASSRGAHARSAFSLLPQRVGVADRIAFAGPLTCDDGQTMIGSLLVIDFPDRTAAERWQADEPFARAGVYQSASVLPFVNLWPQMAGFPPAA